MYNRDSSYLGQSQHGCQFGRNVSFIAIRLLIFMYANIAIFNPEVINNLDGDNNSIQSEVRGMVFCHAYLGRHPRDGQRLLQGECMQFPFEY